MCPSLLDMFLIRLHHLLHQPMVADKVTVLQVVIHPVTHASSVASLVTSRGSALKMLLDVELLHPRKLPSLLVLDAVV